MSNLDTYRRALDTLAVYLPTNARIVMLMVYDGGEIRVHLDKPIHTDLQFHKLNNAVHWQREIGTVVFCGVLSVDAAAAYGYQEGK